MLHGTEADLERIVPLAALQTIFEHSYDLPENACYSVEVDVNDVGRVDITVRSRGGRYEPELTAKVRTDNEADPELVVVDARLAP